MKKIYLILFILIVILAGLSLFLHKNIGNDNTLTLKYKDKIMSVKFETIEKMKHTPVTDFKGKTISAVKLSDIINLVTENSVAEASLKSKDGIILQLDGKDIPKAYLVLKEKKGEKYYRLAIPSDKFGQRWLKYIVTIIVK